VGVAVLCGVVQLFGTARPVVSVPSAGILSPGAVFHCGREARSHLFTDVRGRVKGRELTLTTGRSKTEKIA